jgi:hypothetical protein
LWDIAQWHLRLATESESPRMVISWHRTNLLFLILCAPRIAPPAPTRALVLTGSGFACSLVSPAL